MVAKPKPLPEKYMVAFHSGPPVGFQPLNCLSTSFDLVFSWGEYVPFTQLVVPIGTYSCTSGSPLPVQMVEKLETISPPSARNRK